MALKVSTGLRNHMLALGSLKDGLDGAYLRIYKGTVPATADAAIAPAILICQISLDGLNVTGLTFDTLAVNGIISKTPGEAWLGTIIGGGGTATFFRMSPGSDIHAADLDELRIQGAVGVVGAELNLSSVNLSDGGTQTINHFNVALPTL